MLEKYLISFFVSMAPLIEIRGGMPIAVGMDLPEIPALIVCMLGNMAPVPIIYFFARKVLRWGSKKKYIGKVFAFFLDKGKKAGKKLSHSGKKRGLFLALMLFVAIPIPGTGAWTGTLAASFLNMGIKKATASVCLGVLIAGILMTLASHGVFTIFGLY